MKTNPHIFLFCFFLATSCLGQRTKPPAEPTCGDLLEIYAKKPQHLTFLECKVGSGQTKLEATYTVSGKESAQVESFFVENYGMGKLQFLCCGWEPTGKMGWVKNSKLEEYDIEISMWGNAEKNGPDRSAELETDRTKVDFSVRVRILDI